MRDTSLLTEVLHLVVQPSDIEAHAFFCKLGLHPIPDVPELLCLVLDESHLPEVFCQISQQLSETGQMDSRFILTRSPLHSKALLIEFLNAQPLSQVTVPIKHQWFFQALADRAFVFKYQPIYNLASGDVMGYECLARTAQGQDQYFNGKQILDAALLTHCTHEFDELARETCINAIAQVSNGQTFFINVLPNALLQGPQSLERNLEQVLNLGLQPQQIVFELTEVEALMQHPELVHLIQQIREYGFGVAIDDLGGQVAIDHYFMALRPDVIKLDRQLIQGCSRHPLQQILLKSLLYSAHEMDVLVVAEGLETLEDIAFCRDLGVDLGQGFGLAKPEVTLQQHSLDILNFRSPPINRRPAIAPLFPAKSASFDSRKPRLTHAIS
ncbi:MAG: EAL domain-containing protein [Trichocoleus desertorum ATA4-8-CV12]|nr:EAL domain-containing protein [Trichocoleus desertorum ATA4-8-CV12]